LIFIVGFKPNPQEQPQLSSHTEEQTPKKQWTIIKTNSSTKERIN